MNLDNLSRRLVVWVARLLAAWLAAWLAVGALAGHADQKTTILVLGDSLSAGYRLAEGEGWVDLLAEDIARRGLDFNIVNDSISGDTTAGGAARLPSALERIRPHWVIIELGGNDGLRGSSLEAMERNLLKMVRVTRAQGARPILFGMKLPPNYGEQYTTDFERVYERVAQASGAPLLPFFLHGIEDNPALFWPDGIHPNAQAQFVIMQNVREFLQTLW